MDKKEQEIEDLVKMIDGKMDDGINRLSVQFVKDQPKDYIKEKRFMGKKDSWNPWNWGEA